MIHGSECLCRLPIKDRTVHFFPQLQTVCNARGNHRRALLEKLPNCLLHFVSDCCKGILYNHIRFPSGSYKKLKKFKNEILLFANNKASLKSKRAALVEKKGGFLSLILPALASAIFGIVGNIISKKLTN
jgi:hypothetical protein